MTLHDLNQLPEEQRAEALLKCCGSSRWVEKMQHFFPADDLVELLNDAEEQWYECTEADWLEAFTHHPKIGDVESLTKKFASTAQWASGEQGAVASADVGTIEALAKGNDAYEQKFGFIFIVCATGKSAAEMLQLLEQRLPNTREQELKIAMEEQLKITQLRLQKLLA
jgi:2-oxo-4-hydroxy-4-carboxy-5-ureidoimidazoline decarboxylase